MYTAQDLVNKLQEGADPSDLANEFATLLNEAIAKNDELNMKARQKAGKLKAANDLAEQFNDFLEIYYPDLYDENMRQGLTGEALIETIDTLQVEITKLLKSLDTMAELFDKPKSGNKITATDADDVFKAFFKANHI